MTRIRFNMPTVAGRELEYMGDAVAAGHLSSDGPFTTKVVDLLRDVHAGADVLLTTSCTAALEMSAMLLDLRPGDTVVVPSFTFVSSALAFARAGARILFADIEPDTLGIDPDHVAELIDDSVRAVAAVHYGGIGCRMDELQAALANHPQVELIEDNAHGLFGAIGDRPLGSFGRFSALSFHETKNFICGEGGALVLNDGRDVDRAHVLLEKGTNRRAFTMGQVDKYSWVDVGWSFGLSDLLAAFLLGQLEQREAILAKRRHVFETYGRLLAAEAERFGLTLPHIPDDRTSAYHMYHILLPDRASRDRALFELSRRDVHATFHYVPLHSSVAGRRFAARETSCPVTDDVSGRLLRLPFHNALTDPEIERVVTSLVGALDL